MADNPSVQTRQMDMQAAARLRHLLFGAGITQAISVVAALGIADLLTDGPRSAAELAAATRTHEQTLYRVLRMLAGEGVFTQDEHDHFGLTAVGNLLRSNCVGSQRSSAIMKGSPWEWSAWGALRNSVEDGRAAFSHVHGTGLFPYLNDHPEAAAIFNDMMTGLTSAKCAAILGAYDFSWVDTFADVGGGHGVLMAQVLAAHPGMHGVLFDLPSVVEGAAQQLEAAGVAGRCRIVGGSFLDSVPGGADLYCLVSILLDWNDQDAVRILRTCRAAMRGRGRLLVVDWLIPPGSEPHPSKLLDLQMLVLFGGQPRTEGQSRILLAEAGFDVTRVIGTRAGFGLIEAVPRLSCAVAAVSDTSRDPCRVAAAEVPRAIWARGCTDGQVIASAPVHPPACLARLRSSPRARRPRCAPLVRGWAPGWAGLPGSGARR